MASFFIILLWFVKIFFVKHFEKRVAQEQDYSNEAALSLRSRRSGTKFATPDGAAH